MAVTARELELGATGKPDVLGAKYLCMQCYDMKPAATFRKSRGEGLGRWCADCREFYTLPLRARLARRAPRRGLRAVGQLRVVLVASSKNRKTGPIPVSTSSSETCPSSCSFYGQGCYAEYHQTKIHWSKVPERGVSWDAFCQAIRELPVGQLWRHNEAGDLPGVGKRIAPELLMRLVAANVGRRGFTFTHKPMKSAQHRELVASANRCGFTINLSADSLREADQLAALEIAPVAVVVPKDAPIRLKTPAGRRVVICPAETSGLTCEQCKLCAQPNRKAIIGFRAHGQSSAHVSQLVQLRRKSR